MGDLADKVLTIVHAFSDRGRKDAVRDLAAQVAVVESENERQAKVIAAQVRHLAVQAAGIQCLNKDAFESKPDVSEALVAMLSELPALCFLNEALMPALDMMVSGEAKNYVTTGLVHKGITWSLTIQRESDEALTPAKMIDSLKAENEKLRAERDEARDWVRKLTAEERVLTCVYCGHAYPPGSPTHGADVLTEHARVCEKHPLRAAEAETAKLRAALEHVLERLIRHADRDGHEPNCGLNYCRPQKICDCALGDAREALGRSRLE